MATAVAAVAATPAALLACRWPLQRAAWLLPCCSRPPRARRPFPLPPLPWRAPGGMRYVAVEALRGGAGGGEAPLAGAADRNVAEAVKNIVETARRASSRRSVMHTNFLTPPVVKEAMTALEKLADVKAVSQGGYPQAERCRLSVGHPDTMDTIPDAVAAVRISGNFEFDPCSHGDFLGAILGAGIVREKVGDILLQGEKGAQVLVVPELVDFLVSTLGKGSRPLLASSLGLWFGLSPTLTKSCWWGLVYLYILSPLGCWSCGGLWHGWRVCKAFWRSTSAEVISGALRRAGQLPLVEALVLPRAGIFLVSLPDLDLLAKSH